MDINRIKYVDLLKVIAIASVIALHVFGISTGIQIRHIYINNFSGFVRFGVPLFLMVTGMLTLNKDIDLEIFFKKKFVRIVYPLLLFLIYGMLTNVYQNPLQSFWYCWMIIAAYLAIPILNKYVSNCSLKDLRYFIVLFLISSAMYTFSNIFVIKSCIDLFFFLGPASYLLLGYYLSKCEFNLNPNLIIVISILVFISTSLFKMYGNYDLFLHSNSFIDSYLDMSIIRVVQTAAIFLMIKYLYKSSKGVFHRIRSMLEKDYINRIIVSISRSTYGMYLFHLVTFRAFILPYFKTLPMTGTQACIALIIVNLTLFFGSWFVILILSRIPIIKSFSGYY